MIGCLFVSLTRITSRKKLMMIADCVGIVSCLLIPTHVYTYNNGIV